MRETRPRVSTRNGPSCTPPREFSRGLLCRPPPRSWAPGMNSSGGSACRLEGMSKQAHRVPMTHEREVSVGIVGGASVRSSHTCARRSIQSHHHLQRVPQFSASVKLARERSGCSSFRRGGRCCRSATPGADSPAASAVDNCVLTDRHLYWAMSGEPTPCRAARDSTSTSKESRIWFSSSSRRSAAAPWTSTRTSCS